MENFVVSARKYRPVTFESVVGQESITSTLQNAIKNNHLGQSFLFCGPRGVGKTTCARILAKEINIHAGADPTSDFAFNIFELDAASNNSVEDIRGLIDQVRIPPQTGKYKVYIIDEVHMLSANAFNAFLKTLEEPPAHAKFILATTEKHKILPTILSRCQIFDFRRISVEEIVSHLVSIAEKEGITAEPDALHIIAQKADGGLRDALSIFDQLVSFSGNSLTYEAVIKNLNVLDYDYYFRVVDAVLSGDIATSLMIIDDVVQKGFNPHNFINGLAAHLRDLLVCQDEITLSLLDAGENLRQRYLEQSRNCSPKMLLHSLRLLGKADVEYKGSKNPRLLVELTLLDMCSLQQAPEDKKKTIAETPLSKTPEPEKKNPLKETASVPGNTEALGEQKNFPVAEEPAPEIKEPINEKSPVVENPPGKNLASADSQSSQPIQESLTSPETEKTGDDLPAQAVRKKPTRFSNIKIRPQEADTVGEPEKENENQAERPREVVTTEGLKIALTEYAQLLKEQGRDQMAVTLTAFPPELEGEQATVFIENHAQEERLKEIRTELLDFLRNKLQNFELMVTLSITSKTTERRPYTNREKFKHMADKNPNLIKLQQLFDLDID